MLLLYVTEIPSVHERANRGTHLTVYFRFP
jgi:hypothetical protein